MESVARGDHFPGQPAGAEELVAGEHAGQVAWFIAAAAFIVCYGLCDGLHFSLVAVCAWRRGEGGREEGERER